MLKQSNVRLIGMLNQSNVMLNGMPKQYDEREICITKLKGAAEGPWNAETIFSKGPSNPETMFSLGLEMLKLCLVKNHEMRNYIYLISL